VDLWFAGLYCLLTLACLLQVRSGLVVPVSSIITVSPLEAVSSSIVVSLLIVISPSIAVSSLPAISFIAVSSFLADSLFLMVSLFLAVSTVVMGSSFHCYRHVRLEGADLCEIHMFVQCSLRFVCLFVQVFVLNTSFPLMLVLQNAVTLPLMLCAMIRAVCPGINAQDERRGATLLRKRRGGGCTHLAVTDRVTYLRRDGQCRPERHS
jgi:hypothetical protein